ncbi:MAG: hypothetical protein IJJ63_03110 [Bacilli bacterium]|nr:hypothetical protein [Bacilli bacterium]
MEVPGMQIGGSVSNAADEEQSGYNKKQIDGLDTVINTAMKEVGDAIVNKLEEDLVKKVGEKWYAQEAKDYFKDVHDDIAKSGETIQGIFSKFRDALQQSGESWANTTKNAAPSIGAIKNLSLNLNTSSIKILRDDGAAVLYEKDVNTIADGLDNVEKDLKTVILKYKEELDASTAFIGHGQSEAINDCFNRILEEVHKLFQKLLVGDGSVKVALKGFKEKYKAKATSEAESFKNAKVQIDVQAGGPTA